MSVSPINRLEKFNIVLVVYKHSVPPALSPTNFRFVAGSFSPLFVSEPRAVATGSLTQSGKKWSAAGWSKERG